MSLVSLRVVVPLAGGILGFFYFAYARDYPFKLALIMGAALMILGWVAVRTWERVRDM